jgi:hypothetical protein
MATDANYGSRPFKEAIEFFNQKLPLPTSGWQDVYGQQHDHAFMVAGANKAAILEGFANAIQGAIENGETLADFRKRFDEIVTQHGWDYKGSRNWRSRLIYETNIRQAYNAGREAQMSDPAFQEQFPYMEYRHSGAENFRPQHKAWDRLLLLASDPWWHTHSPSNGYGCKCKKFPRSRRWARKNGISGPQTAPVDEFKEYLDKRTGEVKSIPLGIDPGFEYKPGAGWLKHATLTPSDLPSVKPIPLGPVTNPSLPEPTSVPASVLLADGLTDQAYIDAFLEEFGGARIFKDIQGEPIAINDNLFKDASGQYKVSKDKIRHRYMRLLARALIQPDEIWALLEPDQSKPGKYRLKRRYIARWVIEESGQAVHGFSAFEYSNGAWSGNTVFTPHRKKGKERIPEKQKYLEEMRGGVLLYRKED